eukprot:UN09129
MKKHNIQPDNCTYIGILKACNKGEKHEMVSVLFEEMKRSRITPLPEFYPIVISSLASRGLHDEISKITKEMDRRGINMNEGIYCAIIHT